MANEFIEKEVTKERTGANVSPIQVDTQSRYLLNPTNVEGVSVKTPSKILVHENMFIEAIGKIAKESEQLKLNNEKNLLDIAMKNKDLEFEEKWSTVQDKYGDRFEEYLKDYNEVIESKKSLIVNSKYLDTTEKKAFSDSVDINYKDWGIKEGVKRNQYYIKEQNDIALATLEQRRAIGAKYGLDDDEKAKENYTYMRDTIEHIAKLSGMSEEEKIVMLGKNIGGTEVARLNNRIMEIQNSSMTLDKKKIEIDEVIAYMDNKKIVNDLVDTTMEFYKGNDKKTAREYLKVQFEGETKSVLKGIKSQIDEFQREQVKVERARIKAEKAMQKFYRQQANIMAIKNEKKYEDDLFKRDAVAVASYIDNKKGDRNLSLKEFLDNPAYMQKVTDKGWDTFGNVNSGETLNIVPSSLIGDLKNSINDKLNSGQFTRREAYQEVYDVADNISNGNEAIRNNVLKDIGLKLKVDPSIIINGEKNSKYYNLSNSIAEANNFIDEMGYSISDLKKTKENKKFKEISQMFSTDKELGDQLAFRYLVGEELKKSDKKDLAKDLDRTLSIELRKNGYNKENVETTSEFTSKRKNYRYSKLKDVREKESKQKQGNKNQEVKNNRKIKSDVLNKAQASALGG